MKRSLTTFINHLKPAVRVANRSFKHGSLAFTGPFQKIPNRTSPNSRRCSVLKIVAMLENISQNGRTRNRLSTMHLGRRPKPMPRLRSNRVSGDKWALSYLAKVNPNIGQTFGQHVKRMLGLDGELFHARPYIGKNPSKLNIRACMILYGNIVYKSVPKRIIAIWRFNILRASI